MKIAIASADTPAPVWPQMAAGLWRQRVASGQDVSVTPYCLDLATASVLTSFNQQLSGHCSEHQMALSSDGAWHFRTVWDAGATGKEITEGTIRGDFASHVAVDAAPASAGGAARVTADVKRLGDCPRDMKSGAVIAPGGAHSRLSDLAANA